jgi:uncharacterized membrane protein
MGSKRKKKSGSVRPKIPQIIAARALLVLAMATAGYLAWIAFNGGSLPGCGPESSCDKVLQSRWAYWLGIPVTVPALGIYALLLAATFLISQKKTPPHPERTWLAMALLSALLITAALWFVGIQVAILKSLCWYCLTAHVAGAIAAVILLRNIPVVAAFDPARPQYRVGQGRHDFAGAGRFGGHRPHLGRPPQTGESARGRPGAWRRRPVSSEGRQPRPR